MEEEIVRRRRWLTREAFLDLLGAVNLMPGPNSTELAIHIGLVRGGWRGLFVAGVCFIAPAAAMVAALAWAYVRFGTLPQITGILAGVTPVVIAIVLQAVWNLGRSTLRTRTLIIIGAGSVVAAALGIHELAILCAAGIAAWAASTTRWRAGDRAALGAGSLALPAVAYGAGATAVPFALAPLFFVFLKTGAVLFGSGYVLLAFLRADLVVRLGWLTERQLLDAIAVGQMTPGPVFTTATFVGYLLGGVQGAALATLGIFLPAFVFVTASGLLLPRVRSSPGARAILDGVNVASLALMTVVIAQLARSVWGRPIGIVLLAVSVLALVRYRVRGAWLLLVGALVGLVAMR
jgi:chromate transporter